MSEAALVCSGVGQTYRTGGREVRALADVTKLFRRGQISVIGGPSGSGKSTLLRILACVDAPSDGRVVLDGTDIGTLSVRGLRRFRRYRLAYIFQNPADNLVEYLTAAEQVRLAAQIRGARLGPDDIGTLFARLRLEHRLDHRPYQLSGGEQQRLSIACAVAGGPAVVLADEPTAELDSGSAALVLDAFRALRDSGSAFVLTSHDAAVLESSDSLLRLSRGEVTESW